MEITLNLVSEKKNAINNFLTKYFEKDMLTDENTAEWSYILKNPLDAVNIISAVMDNSIDATLDIWVSFDPNVFLKIKQDNYNEIIRYILERFSKIAWYYE